jgi:hypothetical protein
MSRATAVLAAAALLAPLAAGAQTIASRIDGVRDGAVQFAFAARPEVCGDGRGSTWIRNREFTNSNRGSSVCISGPVRVTIDRTDAQTVNVRSCVACRRAADDSGRDLGMVPAAEAAQYLVETAHRLAGKSAGAAVSAAAFADSADIGPALANLVRDGDASIDARKDGLFWYGQGDAPTKSLIELYDANEPSRLREHFTFVLSQRRDDPAVDELMSIARTDADVRVRKQALFWLGQTNNPKALAFFRALLVP